VASLPRTTVHEGEFYVSRVRMPLATPAPDGARTVEVIKTEEKGSDVAMATYLVLDAAQGDCESAVIITNDSDLREPLRVVREELGLTTGVGQPASRPAAQPCAERHLLQADPQERLGAVPAAGQPDRRPRPHRHAAARLVGPGKRKGPPEAGPALIHRGV
jgi:hypothetical protein